MSAPHPTSPSALDSQALQQRLEELVEMVLSIRRSVAGPAAALAEFDPASQQRFLDAVALIHNNSVELAYNFCHFAIPALGRLSAAQWQEWVLHVMERYDQGGVLASINAMQHIEQYLDQLRHGATAVRLADVMRVLDSFVTGLNGRGLKLAPSEEVFTDTESLFLPATVTRFETREENFRLYKATAVHLWAQTWFGTWRLDLKGLVADFPDRQRALDLFHLLETLRLDACIARELPGIHREMAALIPEEEDAGAVWRQAAEALRSPDTDAATSGALLAAVYRETAAPSRRCYQGRLHPERAAEVIAARKQRDERELGRAVAQLRRELGKDPAPATDAREDGSDIKVSLRIAPEHPEGLDFEVELDGEAVSPTPMLRQVLSSIAQDYGSIPPELLAAAGHGAYSADASATTQDGDGIAAGGYRYDEWDHVRKQYRKDWCTLNEKDVHPQWDDFVDLTLGKYRGLLKHLYRTFEALRGEDRLLKKQPFGDDIDIDAAVTAYADRHIGLEAPDRLFLKKRKVERDLAVLFLVDMSGSTKGWINDVVRESLVLLCESLETLGDRYAIYGFSGFTHKCCEVFRIKHMDEPYSADVKARISGIKPKDYTRMGAAIRHASALLGDVQARTRLMITLSDGRPDDQDGYRGTYGIEDTHQALMEARYRGIHPYCITIDDQAMEYLPHMYGTVNFSVISDVHKLPYKVSDIYRRITA
jgi:nitric oxide reductase NorD protein